MSRGVAQRYIVRLKQVGATHVPIGEWSPLVAAWAARQARESAMRVELVVCPGHYSGDENAAIASKDVIDAETFHLGYAYNTSTAEWAYCPNYRGARYRKMLQALSVMVESTMPDVVLVDTELWFPPDVAEYHLPGVIAGCSRCQSNEGYMRGWKSIATDLQNTIRQFVPNIPIFMYGAWDWTRMPRDARPATACWPPGSGSGPSPALYRIAKARDIPAATKDVLRVVNTRSGYPWLSAYYDWRDPARGLLTPGEFGKICRVLKASGASGFSLWPGPQVVGETSNDDRCFELLQAGILGFHDVSSRASQNHILP